MNRAHQLLARYIETHPEASYSSIAKMLNTSASTVTRVAQRAGLPPRGGKRLTLSDLKRLNDKTAESVEAKEVNDASNG